ncbi:MAG: YARHG domain-containing protein [Gammaproteobacteria bacterium]|nr:YARHG domain-containing protein [Gammaproteobacteria bacterium]
MRRVQLSSRAWYFLLLRRHQYNQTEIGYRTGDLASGYSGNYVKASITILTDDDLAVLSKKELVIMRNEIYARYGYIFKSGGKMAEYFTTQSWYNGVNNNVSDFITELELNNIKKIVAYEKK